MSSKSVLFESHPLKGLGGGGRGGPGGGGLEDRVGEKQLANCFLSTRGQMFPYLGLRMSRDRMVSMSNNYGTGMQVM